MLAQQISLLKQKLVFVVENIFLHHQTERESVCVCVSREYTNQFALK